MSELLHKRLLPGGLLSFESSGINSATIKDTLELILSYRETLPEPMLALNLSRNNIGYEGAMMLAATLSSRLPILGLQLCGCGLEKEGISKLTDAFSRGSITSLDLGNVDKYERNKFTESAALAFASWLRMPSCTLRELKLEAIGPLPSKIIIAQGILKNKSIKLLDLRRNEIGSLTSEEFCSFLVESCPSKVEKILLARNNFRDSASKTLWNWLSSFEKLTYVDLSSNDLSVQFCRNWKNFKHCPLLRTMVLDDNIQISEGLDDLADLLCAVEKPNIKNLSLSRCKLGDISTFARCFRSGTQLSSLCLSYNRIYLPTLTNALLNSQQLTLEYLDLSHNELTDDLMDGIEILFDHVSSLKVLDLEDNELTDCSVVTLLGKGVQLKVNLNRVSYESVTKGFQSGKRYRLESDNKLNPDVDSVRKENICQNCFEQVMDLYELDETFEITYAIACVEQEIKQLIEEINETESQLANVASEFLSEQFALNHRINEMKLRIEERWQLWRTQSSSIDQYCAKVSDLENENKMLLLESQGIDREKLEIQKEIDSISNEMQLFESSVRTSYTSILQDYLDELNERRKNGGIFQFELLDFIKEKFAGYDPILFSLHNAEENVKLIPTLVKTSDITIVTRKSPKPPLEKYKIPSKMTISEIFDNLNSKSIIFDKTVYVQLSAEMDKSSIKFPRKELKLDVSVNKSIDALTILYCSSLNVPRHFVVGMYLPILLFLPEKIELPGLVTSESIIDTFLARPTVEYSVSSSVASDFIPDRRVSMPSLTVETTNEYSDVFENALEESNKGSLLIDVSKTVDSFGYVKNHHSYRLFQYFSSSNSTLYNESAQFPFSHLGTTGIKSWNKLVSFS